MGAKPFMGWSSWSEQVFYSTNIANPSRHTQYMDWLTAARVETQSRMMHLYLQKHGYTYINLDSGWKGGYDSNGRPLPDFRRFPKGMKDLAQYIHRNGQKLGLYTIPGVDESLLVKNPLISGTSYHLRDIVFMPVRPANAWGGGAKIDYSKPGAQQYINSIAAQFADWGVDFVKLDGVTPGSDQNDVTIDARDDVAAWHKAIIRSGRPIWLEVSWSLDHDYAVFWGTRSNGRRITGDIESYGATFTNWHDVALRFDAASVWSGDAGRGLGWNDLDSLDLVNGIADGLTDVEKRTCMTLWALSCAPLYCGGDMDTMDPVGLSMLSNDEVIAVDQAGRPARRIAPGMQQVWRTPNADGSETVGLFNLDDQAAAAMSVTWAQLGIQGSAKVRDLWHHKNMGIMPLGYSVLLPPHGSCLLKVVPQTKQI